MDSTPEVVQDFKTELNSLFQSRLPVSRAKMTAVTKKAMKAIKYYKHVVMIVEKFVSKGAPAYKVPGLYVIDSIVRQSKHQYTGPKEVYGPRFCKNFEKTFTHLFQCSEEDQSKIIRVLNLWSTNNIYSPDMIASLLKLAPPSAIQSQAPPTNSPQEQPSSTQSAPDDSKDQAAMLVENQEQIDSLLHQQQKQLQSLIEAGAGQPMISLLLNKAQQLQELQAIQQRLISESQVQKSGSQPHTPIPADRAMNESRQQHHSAEFNKALLDDFDYSSDEDEGTGISNFQPPPPDPPPTMPNELLDEPLPPVDPPISEALSATAFIEELNKQFIKSREAEAPPLPITDKLESSPSPLPPPISSVNDRPPPPLGPPPPNDWMPGPPPPPPPPANFHRPSPPFPPPGWKHDHHWEQDRQFPPGSGNFYPPPRAPYPGPPPPPPPPSSHSRFSPPPPHPSFRPRSPPHFRHSRDRDSGFRERSPFGRHERDMSPPPPFRGRRDRSPFRGHSPSYRNWSPPYRGGDRRNSFDDARSDWDRRGRGEERDRESKKVHPPPRPDHITVCSNTVWVGHLGKNADKEQILEAVTEFGPVKSIDHVIARGCAYVVMENRKDAVRAVDRLHVKGQKCKVAWAPGRGLKDKAYKEYWDVDRGISYIPVGVVRSTGSSIETLSDGGWVDPATIPSDMKNNTVDMTIED